MKTKQKYAMPLALLVVFTAILTIQTLAANQTGNVLSLEAVKPNAIDFGQTVEGALGDGKDGVVFGPTSHPADAHRFDVEAGQSYVITVTSPDFPTVSMVNRITKIDESGSFSYEKLPDSSILVILLTIETVGKSGEVTVIT